MGRRLIVVMLIAALIAGGVFYFTRLMQQGATEPVQTAVVTEPQRSAPANSTSVMVAAKDLPAGTLIQDSMLTFRPWPTESVDPVSHIAEGKATLADYAGAVVRTGVRSGEPMVLGNLIKRGESGFLAAVLKPGMRAISITVNESTGVSGFVFPGDQVDLLLSHDVQLPNAAGQGVSHRASETVMHGLRVIAVDQRVGDQDQTPAVARGVTLEATPEQAEKIALLQRMGELRLLLRPLAASENTDVTTDTMADPRTFTIDSDLSQIIAPPAGSDSQGTAGSVQLIRGTTKSTELTK